MDNNNFAFTGMPFPFSFMLPQQRSMVQEKEPPMRVCVAMEYLRLLTNKTSDGAVPHGLGAVEIDGQILRPAETAAQTAACELLRKYFQGDLKPDTWEEAEKNKRGPVDAGKLIECFLCRGKNQVDPSCTFCRGHGTILVYPTAGGD